MIDLTPLEPYIVEDNSNYDHIADVVIEDRGFVKWFDDHINLWCNCAFVTKDGRRVIQTNDKRYNYEITTVVHMIEKYAENKDYFYETLIALHNANLEYEKLYGFAYDPHGAKSSNKSSNKSRKKTKQTSLDFGDKPKKETAAEKKLKAHAAKISMLTFKIKPANGDNTL